MKRLFSKAFSLAELMVFLLFVSVMLAAFAPVLTKYKNHPPDANPERILPGTIVSYNKVIDANNPPPTGWLPCDGTTSTSGYSDLAAIVGSTTPDLRGRYILGYDGSQSIGTLNDSKNKLHYHGIYTASGSIGGQGTTKKRGLRNSANLGVTTDTHSYDKFRGVGTWTYYYYDGRTNHQLVSEGRDASGNIIDATDAHPVNYSLNYIIKT